MKVLQVLPTLSTGGAEGFVTNLGVSQAKLGANVRFYLLAGVRHERGKVLLGRLRTARIEVSGSELRSIRSPSSFLHLVRLIRAWRPNIVQANLYSCEVACAASKALTIGSGACYTRRLAATTIYRNNSPFVVRIMDRLYRQSIACSPAVAKSYMDIMQRKHKSNLVTVPSGGLLREKVTMPEEKRLARKTLGIPEESFVVAHIGSMHGNICLQNAPKAHDVLIESFARAFNGEAEKLLVLVGDGPLRSEAEDLAQNLGIAKRIRFLGQQAEPWPSLIAADMFCFPSRSEGLPNVLPEAASCGLPVLASDISEISDIRPDGNVWLLKPANDVDAFAEGLREVSTNHAIYQQRAKAAAPLIRQRFSMETCAMRYLKAYECLLERSGRSSD